MRTLPNLLFSIVVLSMVGLAPTPAESQTSRLLNGAQISLQKQLETGLKARRPEEFAFIERVVKLVDQGTLPRQLVQETFVWARKKERYPHVYFERALRIRATRLGIEL